MLSIWLWLLKVLYFVCSTCSWFGQPVIALGVPSMCVTTWTCGEWSGQKLSIWCATTLHRRFLLNLNIYNRLFHFCVFFVLQFWFFFILFLLQIWYNYQFLNDFSRGNWWGHAPYKYGAPCSACPASYGGGCRDNLCYKGELQFYFISLISHSYF